MEKACGAPRAVARGTFGFSEASPTLLWRNHAEAPVRLRSQRTTARHPHSPADGSSSFDFARDGEPVEPWHPAKAGGAFLILPKRQLSFWAATLFAFSVGVGFCSATDVYSGSPSAKDFTNTTLWVGGVVPGINDNIFFTNASNQTISWTIDTTNANAYFSIPTSAFKTLAIGSSVWTVTNDFILGQSANTTGRVSLSTGTLVITNSAGTARLMVGQPGAAGSDGLFSMVGGTLIVDQLVSTNTGGDISWGYGTMTIKNGSYFLETSGVSGLGSTTGTIGVNILGGTNIFSLASRWSMGENANNLATTMLVSGAGTLWSNTQFLSIGHASPDNIFIVSNGAAVKIDGQNVSLIGGGNAASNNVLTVTGTNSSFTHGNIMNVGGGTGPGNQINILAGGFYSNNNNSVLNIGNAATSYSNSLLVSGAGSLLSSPTIRIGQSGSSNLMIISSGGTVSGTAASGFVVGNGVGSSYNLAVITDSGSTLTTATNLLVGSSGSENTMIVSNGASVVVGGQVHVGSAVGGTNNLLLITGDGSLVQIAKALYVGSNAVARGSGKVLIENGGTLEANGITNGFTDVGLGVTGLITNNGGIFQFTTATPGIQTNTSASIVLTNGTISYRNVSAANIYAAGVSNITFRGNNTFRLNSSTNANVAYYVFSNGNGNLYQNLSMVNGNTRWDANGTVLGTGSTLSISNSIATFAGNITNTAGTITLAGGSTVTLGPATVIQGTGSGNGAIVNIGGNNTMAGAVNLGGNATIGATLGQLTMSGNITNSGSVFTISPAANTTNIFSGVLTGTGSISKSGAGVVIFSGASANDFSGTITITAGTMKLSKNAGVNAIAGNVTIDTGGTLLMGASNQFAAGSNMTLNGGTFTANSFSEGATTTVGLGTLTLTENSTIDLSGTAEVIHFAASNGTSWTAGKTLEIKNFDNGTDIIAVGTDATGLDSTQLSQISFRDPTGWTAGTYYGAAIDSNGHLTIVPEPGTIASAFLITSLLAWHKRRKT